MLGHRFRPHRAALLLIALAVAGTTYAQESGLRPERLRRAIEEHYRVVPLKDGVALVPQPSRADVSSIELSGETIAIDGAVVTSAEVREKLKDDADAVLALSYLDPADRKALFGLERRTPQPEAPKAAEPPTTEEPTRYERPIHRDTKVHIGGSVHVSEQESIDGPVVAIGGGVTVDGEVRDDVVAIGGSVRLGPKARVRGDVTSIGGQVEKDPAAEIVGDINEIGFRFPHVRFRPSWWVPGTGFLRGPFGPPVELMASLFRMLLFGLLAFFALLVARDPVSRIEHTVAAEPWKAGLVGLLTELLFVPVFVLTIVVLAVSIVGIPLLLFVPPLAILGLVIALVLGLAGVASRLGRWIEQRLGWARQGPFIALLAGLLVIWALTIVGRFVSLGGWPIWFVSSALLVAGFAAEYVAWTVGLGAAVMTRLGSRPGAAGAPPAPPAATAPASAPGGAR